MPKFVVSTTLDRADWNNSTIISADVQGEVSKLKDQIPRDILVAGSGQLVRTLMQDDLVDEFRFMVHPLVLGNGKRLFNEGFAERSFTSWKQRLWERESWSSPTRRQETK